MIMIAVPGCIQGHRVDDIADESIKPSLSGDETLNEDYTHADIPRIAGWDDNT